MSAGQDSFDVIVVGGGIAGVSVAGELASGARVLVLEREAQPAYHASGRSAAIYIEPYSTQPIFALTRATLPFLLRPPEGFTELSLVDERGYLLLAPPEQADDFADYLDDWGARCPEIREVSVAEARERVPVLREDYARRVAFDPQAWGLDTNEMIQGWLRMLRRHGGEFRGGVEVRGVERRDGRFLVDTSTGPVTAPVLVNAAGAWSGQLARLAGATQIAMEPRRRSAVLVDAPAGADVSRWPAVSDVVKSFYFKPEGGQLMISPADQTPSEACDAAPEEFDLAVAVDRAERAADLAVRRFQASWAGLRTFAPDENPVYGWDPQLEGFYWCAGQGGVGFQTSAAGARWCAAELGVGEAPAALGDLDFDPAAVRPERFA